MKRSFILLSVFLFFTVVQLQGQIITTIAGNGTAGYSGDGGPATDAKFGLISAVAVDVGGNVYINDASNNVVRKVNTLGIVTTFAGKRTAGFSGDGGAATNAELSYPDGITVDNSGNIYVTDLNNRRIRKIDPSGIITTFAGNGINSYSGDGGPATAAAIGGCVGICSDAVGNIYMTNGPRIRKVNALGMITTYAGNGTSGNSGDGGPATAAAITTNGQLSFDAMGNLYFACPTGIGSVRKINASGIISTVAGKGVAGYSGDGGPATAAQINNAIGVFPDKCGNLYIADAYNYRIRKVYGNGIINTIAGIGTLGYSGDGNAATAAKLNNIGLIYLDKNSSIYIADGYNYVVRYIHMDSCKNVTAVNQVTSREQLKIYPNPNKGTFRLSVPSAISEQATVVMTNVVGMKVKEFIISTNEEKEIVALVPPGIYLLSITTLQARYVSRILVE